MSASLVGSEMCIRDSLEAECLPYFLTVDSQALTLLTVVGLGANIPASASCLLYTSDAADDM
eukprot:5535595-Alexandrium_andersonii.AAC.1